MRVVVVYDFGFVNGGAAQVAIASALALQQAGHQVAYLCAVGPVDSRLQAACEIVCCTDQQDIGSDSPLLRKSLMGWWNTKARKCLRSLLSGFSPDDTIVHFHGWSKALSPSVLDLPRQMGFAACITLHDYFVVCPNGGLFNYQTQTRCARQPMHLACLACHCDRDHYANKLWRYVRNCIQDVQLRRSEAYGLIAISDTCAREIRQTGRFRLSRLYRLNNPIAFPPVPQVGRDQADAYLYMGRLSMEKGPELFCRAVTALGLKGIVLGEGPLKAELSSRYPDIEFAGWVPDTEKERYLCRCRALVFPSVLPETFGMSVAEVLAVGIPCLVATGTAAAELIEDGRNGLLFESWNLESLKAALLRFESLADDLKGFSFPREAYAMDSHVAGLTTFYQQLLRHETV